MAHMEVQKLATERNSLAEMFIDYTLRVFADRMVKRGLAEGFPFPEKQKPFTREDCSDVFDHFLGIKLKGQKVPLQIWCQTTCYKGNAAGKPESNKTYEIRETIAEALTLRKWLINEGTDFRTIHFTLGPSNYTYGWFTVAKAAAFDLSLYPSFKGTDFFDDLLKLGKACTYEYEFAERLDQICENPKNPLSRFVEEIVSALIKYFEDGCPKSSLADMQANLLLERQHKLEAFSKIAVSKSKNTGMDIKNGFLRFVDGESIHDPVMLKTARRLLCANPFLPAALDAIDDWASWCSKHVLRPDSGETMKGYIVRLWKEPTEARFVIHRVLFRIYADNIHYIQDLNIQGVDEHNQYNGDLTSYQISQIADYLVSRYALYKISSPQDLYERLVGPRGLTLTKESLRFESKNGTSLKPSFFYLEDYLLPKYELVSFEEAGLQPPVAFYTKFPGSPNVSTYDNMKVVRDASTKKNLCIVKAKFFRQQEFPRRAKEEAYVGFTTKYEYLEGHLKLRYSGLPLFMFVDMAADYVPPAHAIIRMINYCWIPIFQLQDLVHYLETGKIYES